MTTTSTATTAPADPLDQRIGDAEALLAELQKELDESPARVQAARAARDTAGWFAAGERADELPPAIRVATATLLRARLEQAREAVAVAEQADVEARAADFVEWARGNAEQVEGRRLIEQGVPRAQAALGRISYPLTDHATLALRERHAEILAELADLGVTDPGDEPRSGVAVLQADLAGPDPDTGEQITFLKGTPGTDRLIQLLGDRAKWGPR